MPEGLPTPPSEKSGFRRGSGGAGGVGGAVAAVAPGSGHGGAAGGFEDIYNITGAASNNGEREYLNSPDEVLYMQVFVDEVGVWMDSLDRDKHFSRIIPFVALKSPMMLNAFLACGVKHLTLVNEAYKDDKALFYYDTATTQLLRSLQNPDRDIVECATTAVVLNVYEIMSEKPNERMNHIAGARALIRECGWDARSKGIGAACFWLNIGMEVLSCLAFNWPTAWDPDQWGLDTSFANELGDNNSEANTGQDRRKSQDQGGKMMQEAQEESTASSRKPHQDADTATSKELTTTAASLSAMSTSGDEETWVHRIFYIVAKIANFRAGVAVFPQEPSPIDHQVHMQNRFEEWKRLKRLCAIWNRDCPRSMRPFSYLFPSQSTAPASIFPNIWSIQTSQKLPLKTKRPSATTPTKYAAL
ncbi:c6 zinc finger domain containing protein [Sporothrix brasiliensis 5110]|uniref:C6 zinc finger domain containing protein n=1 Tax=Sporothrix brasiliensis 5110 TaxID=1398154 RepID=A0A0C2FMI2_9PEZI|nr:c6 zinc finger domain containing protein [Sporothrix brasiliensis 5110]KIH92293.1 c6 zinc finger domain containing protein [Sporothrix brasiliensis 5110]